MSLKLSKRFYGIQWKCNFCFVNSFSTSWTLKRSSPVEQTNDEVKRQVDGGLLPDARADTARPDGEYPPEGEGAKA